jgi:hypothetical protein
MSKPGGCHSSGISLGDVLRLPKRHPARPRAEVTASGVQEINLVAFLRLGGKGKHEAKIFL